MKLSGQRITKLRLALGLSQVALAEAAGLSPGAIQRAEANAATPHPSNVKRIADALGVETSELWIDADEAVAL